ncbi:MAG: phosphatase PAP2 family protein [Chloroflexi bacterium]|nr:phosphatase PAP2 family protein [Chloroflexota bacterium]
MSTLLAWGANIIVAWQTAMPWLVAPMKFFTFLGTEEFFLLLLPVLYWSVDAGLGLRVGLLLLASNGLNGFFKLAFHAPRPYWVDSRVKALTTEAGFGLPSGHAQNAVVVWGTVADALKKRRAWAAAAALILLISVSRWYVGVHFPTDGLGGWILGGLILWMARDYAAHLAAWWRRESLRGQLLAALALSAALIALGALGLGLAGNASVLLLWEVIAASAAPPGPGQAAISPLSLDGMVANAGALLGLVAGYALLVAHGKRFHAGGAWGRRLLRFAVGLLGTALLFFGLRLLLPRGADLLSQSLRYLRYALTTFWIIYGAPWLFLRLGLARAET